MIQNNVFAIELRCKKNFCYCDFLRLIAHYYSFFIDGIYKILSVIPFSKGKPLKLSFSYHAPKVLRFD